MYLLSYLGGHSGGLYGGGGHGTIRRETINCAARKINFLHIFLIH